MGYQLSLKDVSEKNIYSLGDDFKGVSKDGEEISFTNYYMRKNGKPFFGISGEFHYSRMSDTRWEDELIKIKMCGVNIIATYVFWIHHEEEEGVFDFEGCRNLNKFIKLCKKLDLYVILRVGPFDHGEVRNGGIPDWMYGKPFEVRKLSDGFLSYVMRLYSQIEKQVSGMFYKDNGPIIGVQIDNEYMHSSAPWEITAGISDEWVFGGDEGEAYMLRLKSLAAECGLLPVFYTCTGWGGAITPESMLPLWGGYAFRPWLFYSYKGEHPATDEYVYQDFHNNNMTCTNDFKPGYQPEEKPYSCCEMGGGMTCCYYYRFQYPYKSVDAMANIKIASGCNFLGYYMFHGGSNPIGKSGTFMNEGQVPKISYDYQAALGEFGQIRESYRRVKSIHYFIKSFGEKLCGLQTVLPEGAADIDPKDKSTLRYAVRTDGKSGYLFVNNYQDHVQMPDRTEEEIQLHLPEEDLTFKFGIAGDENGILPFHLDMDGIDLVQATAQPLTRIVPNGEITYVFFVPDGMKAEFVFEKDVMINGERTNIYRSQTSETDSFTVRKDKTTFRVMVISRKMADEMFIISKERLIFTDGALLEDADGIRLETTQTQNRIFTYPPDVLNDFNSVNVCEPAVNGILGFCILEIPEVHIGVELEKVADNRYTVTLPEHFMAGLKDARLQIDYIGDIGHAFIDGKMINDNFSNGAVWEIGLKNFAKELAKDCITIYITPIREGANVNVESAMAARMEEVTEHIAALKNVRIQPVCEAIIVKY